MRLAGKPSITVRRQGEQLDRLLSAAADRLARVGFRRTQILDVARDTGIAKGSVYSHVESKEALLDLVLRHEIDGFVPAISELPYRTRLRAVVNRYLSRAVRRELKVPSLYRQPSADPRQAAAELRSLVGDLYEVISRNWRAIKILERSALDWPGLFEIYYVEGRKGIHEPLKEYLQIGIEVGGLRSVPHLHEGARFIIESLSWFGMNRRLGPANEDISEDAARETCIELSARAFCFE